MNTAPASLGLIAGGGGRGVHDQGQHEESRMKKQVGSVPAF